jgi:hypothetical protein
MAMDQLRSLRRSRIASVSSLVVTSQTVRAHPGSRRQLERPRLPPQLHVNHLIGGADAGIVDRAHLDTTDGPLHRFGHRSQLADRERAPALGDLVRVSSPRHDDWQHQSVASAESCCTKPVDASDVRKSKAGRARLGVNFDRAVRGDRWRPNVHHQQHPDGALGPWWE